MLTTYRPYITKASQRRLKKLLSEVKNKPEDIKITLHHCPVCGGMIPINQIACCDESDFERDSNLSLSYIDLTRGY